MNHHKRPNWQPSLHASALVRNSFSAAFNFNLEQSTSSLWLEPYSSRHPVISLFPLAAQDAPCCHQVQTIARDQVLSILIMSEESLAAEGLVRHAGRGRFDV